MNRQEFLKELIRQRGSFCSHGIRWEESCTECEAILNGEKVPSLEEMGIEEDY